MTFNHCKRHLAKALLLTIAMLCAASLLAQAPASSFDAPHAGRGDFQGTIPTSISATGLIAGYYTDKTSHAHGFLRRANGSITEFDVPGIQEPAVTGVNSRGQVIGYGTGPDALVHAFLRNADGSYLGIDPLGSVETIPKQIRDDGEITGWYEGAGLVAHGFIRAANGTFTMIDNPDGIQGFQVGTACDGMNSAGVTTGTYIDKTKSGRVRGFVRDAAGNFTNFDATAEGSSATPVGINLSGQVAGTYVVSGSNSIHSFLRDSFGSVTVFDRPGAYSTQAFGVNDSGVVTGQWSDNHGAFEGFRRDSSGTLTDISILNSHGTTPFAINNNGRITGYYVDANSASHGFVQ